MLVRSGQGLGIPRHKTFAPRVSYDEAAVIPLTDGGDLPLIPLDVPVISLICPDIEAGLHEAGGACSVLGREGMSRTTIA